MLPGFGAIGPITLSGVGVAIGVAVTAPERRYLATLGLTAPEARTILERADRTGTRRSARRRTPAPSRHGGWWVGSPSPCSWWPDCTS